MAPNTDMADQPVATVWNEIRIAGDGISISLYSEDADGARIEDEVRFTFKELQEMDGELESLQLSDETHDRMGEDTMSLAEVRESLKEAGIRKRFEDGETVIDTETPEWSADDTLTVHGYAEVRADEYMIGDSHKSENNTTVSDANPSCEPDEPVVLATYDTNTDKIYAFPQSRLKPVSEEA